MNVGAKDFNALLLVRLEQGCASEPNEHGVRQNRFHGRMQRAGLRTMAFVDEDDQLAFGPEVDRKVPLQLVHEVVNHRALSAPELVDERADQPRLRVVELAYQVGAALSSVNLLIDAKEDALD